MNRVPLKFKDNVRHTSILKKTASRICSTQVIYGVSFVDNDINLFIEYYVKTFLPFILKELDINKIDDDLFNSITKGVRRNILSIDEIIIRNLSKKWTINRLSETEKSVLRLATFELCFEKKFKKITIINEYISIIEAFGGNPNFANGILESISN